MTKRTPLWCLIALLPFATSAQQFAFPNGWTITGGDSYHVVNSWVASISITVLDEQSSMPAHLYRDQIGQSQPARVRPKPRPRLGGGTTVSDPDDSAMSYNARIDEASRFIQAMSNRFTQTWNDATQTSEGLQWLHEIDAELVFAVNKRNGTIAIESLASGSTSEDMDAVRKGMTNDDGTIINRGRPSVSDNSELVRLRKFVSAMAPLCVPDCVAGLPGDAVRIRVLFCVAKVAVPTDADDNAGTEAKTNDGVASTPVAPPDPGLGGTEDVQQHLDPADPVLQYTIGCRCLKGDGMPVDPVLAVYHLQKAADQNYTPAQLQLGEVYHLGQGIAPDIKKALFWYKKAAESGSGTAMHNISCIYQNGEMGSMDHVEAARWERKVADLGYPYAETDMAQRYLTGDGVEKNPVQAFQWTLKAAEQGDSFAEYSMGKLYEEGTGTAKDLIEALAWYNLSPTSGLADQTNHQHRLEKVLSPDDVKEARRRANLLRAKIREQQSTAKT